MSEAVRSRSADRGRSVRVVVTVVAIAGTSLAAQTSVDPVTRLVTSIVASILT